MILLHRHFRRCALAILAWAGLAAGAGGASAQELRGLWVDTFHPAMRSAGEVAALVAEARAARCNALFVEVRKRADAYYNSRYEPRAGDITPAGYDPLADLLVQAHTGSPRLEVHAWIVTYHVWNLPTPPAQPDHPFNLHSDWLTRDTNGATWAGGEPYRFDPAVPEVQRHVYNVAMDLISRYDIDGFHFDYIRYSGPQWGYHPVALQRFRQRYQRTDTPAPNDFQWLQFRRDQVTALVRKTYLNAIAIKPAIKLSAATITWAPGPVTDGDWVSSAAWTTVLQDWRGWMEEGILDLNIPMAYFNQFAWPTAWDRWSAFAKAHRYGRHVALGLGSYLNSASNTLWQVRSSRLPTATSPPAGGVCFFSYAAPGTNVSVSQWRSALTVAPSIHDPSATAVFATNAGVPEMPWKKSPVRGHVMGYVFNQVNTQALDGAVVQVNGPVTRVQTNDATGFYGFVDLPPGSYVLTAAHPGYLTRTGAVTVTTGVVAGVQFPLVPRQITNVTVRPGRLGAIFNWQTPLPADSRLEYGLTPALGLTVPVKMATVTTHELVLGGLLPNTNYHFRVGSALAGEVQWSDPGTFRTAGEWIVDNSAATFTGTWTPGTVASDKYGSGYQYATSLAGSAVPTATATFQPVLTTPGYYDVYLWYPQGPNRATNAPWVLATEDGPVTGVINQTAGGGGWRLLAARRFLRSATNAWLRLGNNTGDTGRVIMADAVRWVYSAGQEPPADGEVPAWWSWHYFGNLVNPRLDPDGDQLSTATEYLLGTNPRDAESRLQFAVTRADAGGLFAEFSPWVGGRRYALGGNDDPGAVVWLPVAAQLDLTPAGTGRFAVDPAGAGARFLRLRVSAE